MMYGVWYDDGRMDFGWLAEEGRHGRQHRAEYYSDEEAVRVADREQRADASMVFFAEPIDGQDQERFKRIRKLAKAKRIGRLEAELEAVKKSED